MEKARHGKHNIDKSKRTSKKRKNREENGSSPSNFALANVSKPLVEYSDVSSEDLSGPEAGEIQSEVESGVSFSDEGELSNRSHRRSHYTPHTIVEDEYYMSRGISPGRRTLRLDPSMIPRTPSPVMSRRERKHSVSSRSSRSSEVKRRKLESPPLPEFRQVVTSSPTYTVDYDSSEHKKRKKKEKKHKKDKKYKKKKKRSKHRSRSSSLESVNERSPETPQQKHSPSVDVTDALSDWEAPEQSNIKPIEIKLDTDACSPVSNDSHIASPDPIEEKNQTPSPKPVALPEVLDSPHTPPINFKNNKVPLEVSDKHGKGHTLSPNTVEIQPREQSPRVSLSPVKSSPFRNPSPDLVEVPYTHRASMSPSRKKRLDKEISHRRHRKEKDRLKERKHVSRSRSPIRRRISRSPSWGRRHYSRSPSRSKVSKKYRSRSPKNVRDRERSPKTPPRYLSLF